MVYRAISLKSLAHLSLGTSLIIAIYGSLIFRNWFYNSKLKMHFSVFKYCHDVENFSCYLAKKIILIILFPQVLEEEKI